MYKNINIKIKIETLKTKGKIIFQHKFIKKSYRNRGSLPRTHIIQNNIRKTQVRVHKISENRNMKTVKTDINIIIMYSAMKNLPNKRLLYSVLNPETSSDSPSEKSKGVRFNSAIKEITHIKKIGDITIKKFTLSWATKNDFKFRFIKVKNIAKRIKASLTS